MRQLVGIRLGPARFGLWIDEVLEIVATPPISRLPVRAAEVAGVTSVRGDVVPILDLGIRLLGTAARRPGRLILVRTPDREGVVALLVDAVDALLDVREAEVGEAPPEAVAEMDPEYIQGVIAHPDGVVTVLRLEAAAAPPAHPQTEE